MALFDNGLKIGTPVLLGIGVFILAPVLTPVVASVVKPLVKATIKTGLSLFLRGKELISEAAEGFEDITAEVKAELIAERAGPAANPQADEVS
jgi:ethanolamine transporter EutH